MKLFTKIFLLMLLSFTVGVFSISYLVAKDQISCVKRNVLEKHTAIGTFLSKQIEVGYFESHWPFESLQKLSECRGFLFWWIVRDDGIIHLADKAPFIRTAAKDYFPEIGLMQEQVTSVNVDENYAIFFKPLGTGKAKWSFWYGFSLDEIFERETEILFLVASLSTSALLAVSLALFLGIRHFTKPIKTLSLGASIIGRCDLSHRVKIDSQDEIGALAQSFNKMADDLLKTYTALRESEETAKRTAEVSSTMAEIGRIVSSTLSVQDIYEQFALEVKKIIPFDRISIGLINREQGTYCYTYTSGIDVPARNMGNTVPLPLIIGKIIRERSGVLLLAEDEKGFPEEYPTLSVPFGVGIRSIMFAPLFSKDEVVGALFLGSFSSKAYTERDLKLAETVTRQIGGAVASAQLYAQIKLAEEELKKSRDSLAKLFNSLGDAVFTIKMPERMIESVNTSVSSLFGYAHQECIGKGTEMFYPDQKAYQDFDKKLVKAIKEGEEVLHTQQVLRRKGGELFPAEITRTFLKEHCEIRAIISIVRDITERKRAEDALEEERRRLQKALDDVRTLRGIVPICASCKKIRDDKGYWNQVEKYVSEHSEAQFSHGICPECLKKLYPEFAGDDPEAKT